jgi:hypothetical protein
MRKLSSIQVRNNFNPFYVLSKSVTDLKMLLHTSVEFTVPWVLWRNGRTRLMRIFQNEQARVRSSSSAVTSKYFLRILQEVCNTEQQVSSHWLSVCSRALTMEASSNFCLWCCFLVRES